MIAFLNILVIQYFMLNCYLLLLLINVIGSCLIFLGFVKHFKSLRNILKVLSNILGLCIVCRSFVKSVGALYCLSVNLPLFCM